MAVNCGATLLFMGAASRVCGGGVFLVPEVLGNIRLASNVFRLCVATKMVVSLYGGTGVYGTQDKHNE